MGPGQFFGSQEAEKNRVLMDEMRARKEAQQKQYQEELEDREARRRVRALPSSTPTAHSGSALFVVCSLYRDPKVLDTDNT